MPVILTKNLFCLHLPMNQIVDMLNATDLRWFELGWICENVSRIIGNSSSFKFIREQDYSEVKNNILKWPPSLAIYIIQWQIFRYILNSTCVLPDKLIPSFLCDFMHLCMTVVYANIKMFLFPPCYSFIFEDKILKIAIHIYLDFYKLSHSLSKESWRHGYVVTDLFAGY